MKPETITLKSALGGVLIGSIVNLVISWITKWYEYRRELKKLVITSAVDQWRECVMAVQKNVGGAISQFIIQTSVTADLIGKRRLNEKKVRAAMRKTGMIKKVILEMNAQAEGNTI
jgi:hypothetical protein